MKEYIQIYPYKGEYIVHNVTNSSWIVVQESDYIELLNWKEKNTVVREQLKKIINLYALNIEINHNDEEVNPFKKILDLSRILCKVDLKF